jgi:hypothetical protein
VYHGSSSGLAASPAWTAESKAGASFGISVSTAGDVNGDGYPDVIVGSYDGAFVYHGNGGNGGLVRVLQQRNGADTRPISLLGSTARDGLFHLRAEFPKNLAGFSWASPETPTAWLEWELKPLGAPSFTGSGIERGTAQSLFPPGGTLTFDEPALAGRQWDSLHVAAPVVFHWRARVATSNPLFPHTAWFSVPGNNITESKLRNRPTIRERNL